LYRGQRWAGFLITGRLEVGERSTVGKAVGKAAIAIFQNLEVMFQKTKGLQA
jgi:hypothetical protein